MTSDGRTFQMQAAETAKARSPTVMRHVGGTCSSSVEVKRSYCITARLHVSAHLQRSRSVCMCVSLSAMSTSYVKAPTLTEMPFGVWTPRSPSDYVLSGLVGGPEPPITLCQSKSCQLLCGCMKNTELNDCSACMS